MNTVPFAFCDAVFATLVDLGFKNSTSFVGSVSSKCGHWKAAFAKRRQIRLQINMNAQALTCRFIDPQFRRYLSFDEFYQIRPTTLRIDKVDLLTVTPLRSYRCSATKLLKLLRYIAPLVNSTQLGVVHNSGESLAPTILEILQKSPFGSIAFSGKDDDCEGFLKEQLKLGQLKKLRLIGFGKWTDQDLNRQIEELKVSGLSVIRQRIQLA